jgi:hypothetical protein
MSENIGDGTAVFLSKKSAEPSTNGMERWFRVMLLGARLRSFGEAGYDSKR